MALHEMASQARTGGQRPLEIHDVPGLFLAERSAAQRLSRKIGGKVIARELGDREAAAVDGDAVAELRLGSDSRRLGEAYAHAGIAAVAVERVNFSRGFDNSRKHRVDILGRRNR